MQNVNQGDVSLYGADRKTWTDEDMEDDLVTLRPTSESAEYGYDFALWAISVYHNLIGRHIEVHSLPFLLGLLEARR
jgi:hypothetical protein